MVKFILPDPETIKKEIDRSLQSIIFWGKFGQSVLDYQDKDLTFDLSQALETIENQVIKTKESIRKLKGR